MKLSIIVPCFNEEETVELFYQELLKAMKKVWPFEDAKKYELIFVNDGSGDGTLHRIKRINTNDKRVQYISFSRNFGKESAIYAGLANARGEYVVVMDADMQDPPSLLPDMLSFLEKNNEYDSVATRRTTRKGEPILRSFFARMFYKIMNCISDADVKDGARDFRMMRRGMVDALVAMGERNRFSKGLFGWVGFRTYWLPYENIERVAGKTKWSFWGLFKYSLDGIINFSSVPLAIISGLGILTVFFSLLAILTIVLGKAIGVYAAPGWASLVCIIILGCGVQMFCIGVVGQYIAKIYQEVKNRPHYIASETSNEEYKKIM